MKSINRRIAVIGLTALLLTSAGAAFAFFDGPGKGHRECDHHNRQSPLALLAQLDDLTQEQKDQLKQIGRSARDTMRNLRDEMVDNRMNLHDAIDDRADQATIRQLAEKQGGQLTQMIILRVEIRDKIIGVLTEEQRKQLFSLSRAGGGFTPHEGRMRF